MSPPVQAAGRRHGRAKVSLEMISTKSPSGLELNAESVP